MGYGSCAAVRLVNTLGGRRIRSKLRRRPPGPGKQLTAAIGTSAVQHGIGTVRAEGALKRADSGLGRVRWQEFVAAFTGGA